MPLPTSRSPPHHLPNPACMGYKSLKISKIPNRYKISNKILNYINYSNIPCNFTLLCATLRHFTLLYAPLRYFTVFRQTLDHVITMFCNVTYKRDWHKHFQFHRHPLLQATFYLEKNIFIWVWNRALNNIFHCFSCCKYMCSTTFFWYRQAPETVILALWWRFWRPFLVKLYIKYVLTFVFWYIID